MQQPATAPRLVEIATLGERLSALRLCDAGALTAMRRSLEQHGQLGALTLFVEPGGLALLSQDSAIDSSGNGCAVIHDGNHDSSDGSHRSSSKTLTA